MKKERNLKNESVKEVKAGEKKTTNNVIITKDIKKGVKILSMILAFFAALISIFTFVFSIITSLKVANITKAELLHDNFSVTFISNLNGLSISDTESIIEGYGSKTLFIIFNVVIPAIATIFALILLIIFVKKLMDFINSVNREKDLFTKEKLHVVEALACYAVTIITIALVIYKQPSLLVYMFTCALVFIVIGLFKKCVEYKNNH